MYSTNATTNALAISTLVDIMLNKYASYLNLNFDVTNMSNLLVFINSSELKNGVQDNIFKTS